MRWKKIILRILAVLVILVVLTGALAILILRSRSFHEYVRTKIVEKAAEATGGHIEMGDFAFDWIARRADVYRLTIHGTEADPKRPLFYVDHVEVGFKIISALRRKIDLREIRIEHPVVHIWVDADGRSNLPEPKRPTKDGKPMDIFDMAVKSFVLQRGEFYYNDAHVPLHAELHELQTQIQFDPTRIQYKGFVGYRHGRFQIADLNAMPHDLETQFQAGRSGAQLDHTLIATPHSRVSAHVNINGYRNPLIETTYRAVLSMQDVRDLLDNPSLPLGDVTTAGQLRYKGAMGLSFLESLSLGGDFSSPALSLRLPSFRNDFHSVRGRYRLEEGNLDATQLQATLLGGRASGDFTIRHLQKDPEYRFRGSGQSLSVQALDTALRAEITKYVPVSGQVNGSGEVAWRGGIENLKAHGNATLKAVSASPDRAGIRTASVPLEGVAQLDYDNRSSVLSLTRTHVRSPHTDVDIDGALGSQARLNIRARSTDLHEVDLFLLHLSAASAIRNRTHGPPPSPLGLYGSATFEGRLEGALKDPRITGRATAADFQVQDSRWRRAEGLVEISSSGVAVRRGSLDSATQGHAAFDLTLGLRNWDYRPSNPLSIQATVSDVSVADLQRLARSEYPVTGLVSARLSVDGSQLNPVGSGSVQLVNARVWGEPVGSVRAQFQATGDEVRVSPVTVRAPAGTANGTLVYYPKTQGYNLQAMASQVRIDQLESVHTRNLPVRGLVSATAAGQGTLTSPQLEVTARVPELRVRQETLRDVQARAKLENRRVDFTVDSSVTGSSVQARGAVDLDKDYYLTATVDTRNILLQTLLATYFPAPARSVTGQFSLHAALRGPLKDISRIEAQVEIPRFEAGYEAVQIASTAPIRLNYRDNVLTVEHAELQGTDTSLRIQGSIPMRGEAPVALSAIGTVNLQLLSLFMPNLQSAGQLRLDLAASGDRVQPGVQGRAEVRNAALSMRESPLGLSRMNGELLVRNNRVEIRQLSGQSGGGDVSFQGFVVYRPEVQFNVSATAGGVRLRYPEGVRAVMNSDLALRGTPDASRLSGRVLITSLSLTRQFDLANFLSNFESQAVPPSPNDFLQHMQLNVGVQSAEELGLVSSKLSLQGSANLRLRGTAASPVATGRANLTTGEVFFMGKRYRVERGIVDFVNPVRMEPILNLLVTTTVNPYKISMTFIGPFDRLRTGYVSDPPLPPVDIINLLAFGKSGEVATETLSTPPRLGANAILAQALAQEVSSRAERLFGISNLQIDPLIGGNQRNPSARLAIQQRVTKDFIFTYATDVTSAQRELIQLEYQISRRWSLTLVRDENGSFAFDARFRKTY